MQAPAPEEAAAPTHLDTDAERTSLTFDEDLLPGPTGWFLVPILADEPTSLHVVIRTQVVDSEEGDVHGVPIVADHQEVRAELYAEPLDHEPVAHAADQEVACCTDRFDGMPGYGEWSGWHGTGPEAPLYVGFVASGFTEDAWVTIEVSADHGPVRAGEVATGQDVVAVDLFEAATAQEPAVRIGAQQIVGGPSDLVLSWSANRGGFVAVDWDLPDARGDVELAMPGLAPIDNLPSAATWGQLVAASGPGTAELAFTEAQRSDGALYADPDGQAWAVFADIELPYASAHAWSAPT